MPTYKVAFVGFSENAHRNSFGFKGNKGTVTLELGLQGFAGGDRGTIALETKNPGLFGFGGGPRIETFLFSEIANVTRDGKKIRFEVPGARARLKWKDNNKNQPFFQFWADSEADAIAIESALPKAQTQEFAQNVAEVADFEARLRQVTPVAWVTPTLVAINVVVFVLMAVAGAGVIEPVPTVHIAWGSNFGAYTIGGEWWRLFTCMFLHFGVIHIALNMWALWDLGKVAERLYGSFVFLALYLLAGIGASITSLLWHPDVNSAGASGAIFGILGALLAYMLDKRNGVPLSVMRTHRNAAAVFGAYSLFYGASHAGVDNAAHIGGLISGMILGFALARPLYVEHRRGGARIAVPLAVAAVALVLLTLPLRGGLGEGVRNDEKFRQTVVAAGERETKSVDAVKQIFTEVGKGTLKTPQAVERFGREVLAPYRQSVAELKAIPVASDSRLAETYSVATRYFASRVEAYDLMMQALVLNDESKMKAATEKIIEGNRIVASIPKKTGKK